MEDLQDQREEQEIDLADDKRLIEIDMKIKNANLVRTRTEISRLEERIASAAVRAPMSGEVIDISASLGVAGTKIPANESVIVVADPTSAVADVEILEQYAAAITLGDQVELTISNTKMAGIITQIGRVAEVSNDGLGATIEVRVKPVESPIALLSGSTAVATFILGESQNSLLLSRGPYLTTGSQRYVYVIDGNTAHKRGVTFGQVEGNLIEVISGLSAGDEIISSGYQNYFEYETVKLVEGE